MNAPVPPDDVDSLTLQPWRPPACTARRSGRIVLGVCLVGLVALGALVLMGVRAPSPDSLYETVVVKRQDIESTVAASAFREADDERRSTNLLLGVLIGIVAATLFGMTVIFSITMAVSALLGAVVMRTLFGFMPAFRAARLDPVMALSSQ